MSSSYSRGVELSDGHAAPHREGAGHCCVHRLTGVRVGIEKNHNRDRRIPLPLAKKKRPPVNSSATIEELLIQALLVHRGPLVRVYVQAECLTSHYI